MIDMMIEMTKLLYFGPSLKRLHETYAKQGTVDGEAPVYAAAELDVDAPLDRLWQVLSDVAQWPSWMPSVSSVRLDSAVRVDAGFSWVNSRVPLRSTFAVVEPMRELTWSGISMGIKAVHRNTFQELPGGRVRVRTEESMAAPLLPLLFGSRQLRSSQVEMLASLQRAAA